MANEIPRMVIFSPIDPSPDCCQIMAHRIVVEYGIRHIGRKVYVRAC